MPPRSRPYSQISTYVVPEVKSAFNAVVRAHGTTESKLLGSLVDFFLKRNPPPEQTRRGADASATGMKSERVTLRLTPMEYAELEERARVQGMGKGSYLAALFKAQARNQPQFNGAEMQALREATRELTAIGRNLNQMARALNTSLDHADRARALELEALQAQVERERQAVKALIKANLKAWRHDD